MLIADLT